MRASLPRPGRTRRVLIVSQHFYPFPSQPTLSRNVDELLAHGVAVDLVCITPGHWYGRRLPDRPGLRLYGIPMMPRRSPAWWYPLQYVAFFLWALPLVSWLGLWRQYDVVEVDTIPDLLAFSAIVPRVRGIPVVLYIFDLMPEMTAVRLGLGPSNRWVRLVAAIERAATAWADRVITVTDLFARRLAERGLEPSKVTLVANSSRFVDLPPRVMPPTPVLVVQTTCIPRYGVQVAIRALAELRPKWPNLTLHVLGDGEYRPNLVALAEQLGLEHHVVFWGWVPWPKAMEQVRRATIGIVPIIADGYGELILPNKVFEFTFMEIPFACSRLVGIEENLPSDAVAYFEPGDHHGLAAQVDRLLADPEAARFQALRAKAALADLAWDRASERYLDTLGVGLGHDLVRSSGAEQPKADPVLTLPVEP